MISSCFFFYNDSLLQLMYKYEKVIKKNTSRELVIKKEV